MSEVITSGVLANGLRTDFWDTYAAIRNRQADSRLALVMDLGVPADNREHTFGYIEAAPHFEQWIRGQSIPADAMNSVSFTVPVYTWGRRVKWHNEDREDDRTQSLFDIARSAGESAGLLPERFFFDLLQNATGTLPAVPLAPDGAAFFSETNGNGDDRFGVSGGNLLGGNGVGSVSQIRTDFYNGIEQWKALQDGKGQPLLSPEVIDSGVVIVHGSGNTEAFEETFLQKRQGEVIGTDAGATPTNLVQDASRSVQLWGSSRIADNDWFMFLKNAPKKSTFVLDRKGIMEETSIRGENNGDYTRDTGGEYIQWHSRSGAGIALPFGAMKVNN
tara:strand:- start:26076 stop:27071 length:996 start_codon:yes stop_codon:yes gene_type:complete